MSATTANGYATYKQTAVETATPDKLLIMLFNGGIKYIHQAEQALDVKDYQSAHKCLTRIQDILFELIITLDMEKGGEIAQNLHALYNFYLNEVIEANIKKDKERLVPVRVFFTLLRDTWIEAARLIRIGAK